MTTHTNPDSELTIRLNGTLTQIPSDTTLAALATDYVGRTQGIAIALDGEIVPKFDWDTTMLHHGADIDVVSIAQGG
jgi:sulfur carrier protein